MKKRVGTPVFSLSRLAIAVAGCFCLAPVHANPVGAQVVSGSAAFATQGKTLTITNTPGAIINWQGFSIGAGETTRFTQASAASAVLNRVVTSNPSQLLGQLQSNGRVFLINPAGILVGAGALVDTAGFVASTLNLSNADFLAGRFNFTPTPGAGKVENYGTISTPSGGSVYLVGAQVDNHGIINAPNGEVLLAAGQTAQLIDTGTPGVRVELAADTEQALNVGQILAESGRVGMVGAIVRNSGKISASSVSSEGGRVFLKAAADTYVEQAGSIEATGTTGGTVEVLGKRVALLDAASIDVSGANGGGTILVGGDYQGSNADIQNSTISYVGAQASLKADATLAGNGGKVIVWADDITRYYGGISARGGAQSGNGGFVEVSGKRYLDFQGLVSTAAAQGLVGTLLLDPDGITISTGTSTGSISGNVFDGVYNIASILNSTTLATALESNSVLIDASAGSSYGNVIVDAPIAWSSASGLTLKSGEYAGIAINGAITASSGGVTLNAGSDGVSQSAAITSNTLSVASRGNVNLQANNLVNSFSASMPNYGNLQFNNGKSLTISSLFGSGVGTGMVSSAGNLTVAGLVNWTGGALSLSAVNTLAIENSVTVGPAESGQLRLSAGSGGITSTVGGRITGKNLDVTSVGNVVLNNTNNAVGALSANVTGGSLAFKDSIGFDVAYIGHQGIAATGNVSLNSGGNITQSYAISAAGLEVIAGGNVTLDHASNHVGKIAANVTGDFTFENKAPGAGLVVGTVGSTTGVTSSGNVIVRENESGKTVSVDENVAGGAVASVTVGVSTGLGGALLATGKSVTGGAVQVYTAGGAIVIDGALRGATSANVDAMTGAISTGASGLVSAPLIQLQSSYIASGANGAIGSSGSPFKTSSPGGTGNADIYIGYPESCCGPSAVYLSHTGNAILQRVNTKDASAVDIAASHDLFIASSISTASDLALRAANQLTLAASLSAANLALSSSAGAISQSAGAMTVAGTLTASAATGIDLTQSGNRAATVKLINSTSGDVAYSGSGVSNNVTISGSNSGGGTFSVTTDKNISLGLVSNPGGTVSLTSNDGAILDGNGSSNNISAATVTLSAKQGIGKNEAIEMTVSTVSAINSGNGDIQLDNTGALLTDGVSTGTGSVSIVAHSPLTIGGSGVSAHGDILLTAGNSAGGTGDDLTINGTLTTDGHITLTAGNSITGSKVPQAGPKVSLNPNGNVVTPTIDQCVANPALAGCSTVLPTIAVCTSTPSTPGCSAVLPTIAVCTTAPTTPGCSAVLPATATTTTTTTTTTATPTHAVAALAAVAEPLQAVQGQTASAMDTIQSTAQPSSSPAASSPVALPPPVAGGGGGAQQKPLQTLPGGVVGGEAPDTFGSAPTASASGTADSGEPGGGGEGKNDKKSRKPGKCTA
ncbi:MAG: hemagglutinin-related protein [Proteobacteria bacterium]|nr:hemagglutinin-related protein [Pseudomonadota bacterium]